MQPLAKMMILPVILMALTVTVAGCAGHIDSRGSPTTDLYKSRIVGFRERDQLRAILAPAVAAR
jgi:hypothetical protein